MINSIAPAPDAVSTISNANTINDQTTTNDDVTNTEEDPEAQEAGKQISHDNKWQEALKAAIKGITDFLSETALHGPKYITFKDNKAIRVAWVSSKAYLRLYSVANFENSGNSEILLQKCFACRESFSL